MSPLRRLRDALEFRCWNRNPGTWNGHIASDIDDDGAGLGAPETTWTVYDGLNPYADFDGSGNFDVRYLYAPAIDALLARTDASENTSWYLPDRLGTIRDVVDTAGTVTYHAAYDSFGALTSQSGGGGDRFGFTAREHDEGTNLRAHRHRYADPETGRWTQEDPIGFAGGDANLYRYVGNGPVNATDPSGLMPFPEAGIVGKYMEHLIRRIYGGLLIPPQPPPNRKVTFVEPPRMGPPTNWSYPSPPPKIPPSAQPVLQKIFPIAKRTWIWEFAPEGCERWAFAFEDNLRGFSHPNVKNHGIGWEPSSAIGGGHAVYDFNLTDGTIIRVDHWIYYGGTRYRVITPDE